jgi:Ni/Co efflux regulator RcnB
MRRVSMFLFTILLVLLFAFVGSSLRADASVQDQQNQDQNRRVMHVPHRRRRTGRDVARRKHRGIGHAYKHGGESAGRGGKRFGKNISRGKPLKGGKELGKGMGGLGEGIGKGTGRTGRKVGRKVKHAVTP